MLRFLVLMYIAHAASPVHYLIEHLATPIDRHPHLDAASFWIMDQATSLRRQVGSALYTLDARTLEASAYKLTSV